MSNKELEAAKANLKLQISNRGDIIAKKMGYSLSGMDAIVRYLADKHHWLPHEIRALDADELFLLLDGE